MPIVEKIENLAIKISESISVPSIIVTVNSGFDSITTSADYYNVLENEILPEINGMSVMGGYDFSQDMSMWVTALDQSFPTAGTEDYGTNTGFHFKRRVQIYQGHTYNVNMYSNVGLYYQDKFVCCTSIAGNVVTGEKLKLSPVMIFVDSNYNVYEWTPGTTIACCCVRRGTWPNISHDMNNPLLLMVWDSSYTLITGTTTFTGFTVTNKNITNDIIRPEPESDDPFSGGGYSGPDDGDTGDFNYDGDPQPGNAPATFNTGLDTGFYTLYAPSASELQNLASYLWSTNFDLNLFKRLFNNPMDLFLVLGILPVSIPKGAQKEVGIGLITTGVYMTTAADRVVTKDMGTIHVTGTTASYLDYAPYTHADLLLPFVGVVPIDIDAIMGKDVNIIYNVDVLTGSCVALINAGKSGAMHCVGAYAGNCMRSIPLTGADYTTMLSGLVQTAGAIAAGAASGGAAGAVAGGLSAASSAVVNEGKPLIQKGGAISSSAGFMLGSNQMRPVLIFSLPKQCLPSLQMVEMGFPAYTSDKKDGDLTVLKTLSDYKKGENPTFVKVEEINLKNIKLTSAEIEELESILKEGVFV